MSDCHSRIFSVLLFGAVSARAGIVTWSAPQGITGESDVSTSGTLVVAHNLGSFGNASPTVNGVTFTAFPTSTNSNTIGNVTLSASSSILGSNSDFGEIVAPFAALTTPYKDLLKSGSYTAGVFPPPTISMTLNGLTPNAQYQFQWWAHQSDSSSFDPFAPAPGVPTTTATSGNSVTLDRRGLTPGSLGQYALGVFTATSASQVFSFDGSDTRSLLNAFQLRQLAAPAIPEPSSALVGLALTGVVLRSSTKRRR